MRMTLLVCALLVVPAHAWAQQNRNPRSEVAGFPTDEGPRSVRHDEAQSGEPILTLRYFRIQKGSFPKFVEVSREGVWPFFEKIGARVVGMWQVMYPGVGRAPASPSAEYDEVWLMTRYASLAHWQATRDMSALGGNGPDYQKAIEALALRGELTLETDLRFLDGTTWDNPPYYMPPVD